MCVATGPPIGGDPISHAQCTLQTSLVWIVLLCFAVPCHFLLWWHKTTLGWFYHPEGGGFNKRRGAPRDGEGQCAGCDRL